MDSQSRGDHILRRETPGCVLGLHDVIGFVTVGQAAGRVRIIDVHSLTSAVAVQGGAAGQLHRCLDAEFDCVS